MDPFRLQKPALPNGSIATRSGADFTLVINDPLPGNTGPGTQGGHGVTHHAGRATADDLGDLSVSGNLASRDLADYLINLFITGYVSIFHPSNLFRLLKKSNHFFRKPLPSSLLKSSKEIDTSQFVGYKKEASLKKVLYFHWRYTHGFTD